MRKNIAVGIYLASAVLVPLALWTVDAMNWSGVWLAQNGLAFSIEAVALAVASGVRACPPFLQLTTASLWFGTSLLFAFTSYRGFPLHLLDAEAAWVGLTGLALTAVALRLVVARPTMCTGSRPGRLLSAGGVVLLALYLLRASAQLYAATRVTESAGLAGLVYEAQLRLLVALGVAMLLGAGAVAAFRTRRKVAGARASGGVVEQADAAVDHRAGNGNRDARS